MRSLPEGKGIECRRLDRLLDQVDGQIWCNDFQAKGQDLHEALHSTERYYEAIAAEYDELWYSPAARMRYAEAYSLIQDRLGQLTLPSDLVLDAGCGTSEWATAVVGKGGRVIGLDSSPKMLRVGQRRMASLGGSGNLSLVCGDVGFLPFKERIFDGLMCLFVLSHLQDDCTAGFLRECGRVVRKDGWMLFLDSRSSQLHLQEELQVRTLAGGEEYLVYKRYFEAGRLASLLEEGTGRSFSPQEIDRYVLCASGSRAPC